MINSFLYSLSYLVNFLCKKIRNSAYGCEVFLLNLSIYLSYYLSMCLLEPLHCVYEKPDYKCYLGHLLY